MPILIDDNKLLNMPIDDALERVPSFNNHHCMTTETKLIIVGTLTPPRGTEYGFFYTGPQNLIYSYIDEALNTELCKKKKSLNKSLNKGEIISQIKKELMNNKIAFLDIMKNAIRIKNSSKDRDIQYYSLDIDAFKNLPNSIYFICNSKLARDGYLNICEQLSRNPNYIYLPQRLYNFKSKENKEKWIEVIRNQIFN